MHKYYNSSDYLFIMKEDNYESHDEIVDNLYLGNDGVVDFWFSDDLDFENEEVHLCTSFKDKLRYLYATLYEDTMLTELVKKLVPEVIDVKISAHRRANGKNISEWMEKYNFTLEEFLTNKKYIVISDALDSVSKLMDLGLFRWENIEHSSVIEEE